MKPTSKTRVQILAATLSLFWAPVAAQDEKPASRWEKSIRAFEATDAKSPPPRLAVLFVGSSSIRYWKHRTSY